MDINYHIQTITKIIELQDNFNYYSLDDLTPYLKVSDRTRISALSFFCEIGDNKMAQYVLSHYPNISTSYARCHPFASACLNNMSLTIETMIQQNYLPSKTLIKNCFAMCLVNGKMDSVAMKLFKLIDDKDLKSFYYPDIGQINPLCYAINYNLKDLFELFMTKFDCLNYPVPFFQTPLVTACKFGRRHLLKKLFKSSLSDPIYSDEMINKGLIASVKYNNERTAITLIRELNKIGKFNQQYLDMMKELIKDREMQQLDTYLKTMKIKTPLIK